MAEAINKILLVAEAGATIESPAVRRLIGLTSGWKPEVHVLGPVYEPHLQGYLGHVEVYESLRARLVRERSVELQKLSDDLRRHGLNCSSQSIWGHPDETIVTTAAEHEVDLVLTSAFGTRRDPSHADWQLFATCPVPLLVVRSDGTAAYRSIAAAVDPEQAHGKPPGLDQAILRYTRALQRLTSAGLTVVHCIAPLPLFAPDPALAGRTLDDLKATIEASSRRALDALIAQAGLPAESAVLTHGDPSAVLNDMAERGDADLLVLGTVARGRIQSLVVGSTAQRVLKAVGRDVLLVPPPR